jgi:hypothetical protein
MVTLLNPKVIVDFTELLHSGILLSDDIVKLLKQRDISGEQAFPEEEEHEQTSPVMAARSKEKAL